MKKIHLLVFMLAFIGLPLSSSSQEKDPSIYKGEVKSLIEKFYKSYLDKDVAWKFHSYAADIITEIKNELKNDSLSSGLRNRFDSVLVYATDIGNAISVICVTAYTCEDEQSFNRGAALLGIKVTPVFKGKFCIDFLKVEYKEIVHYLADNNTAKSTYIYCEISADDPNVGGTSQMGVGPGEIRSVFDNRSNLETKSIYFTSVKCN